MIHTRSNIVQEQIVKGVGLLGLLLWGGDDVVSGPLKVERVGMGGEIEGGQMGR